MNSDPGWGVAVSWGFAAVLSRRRVLQVRPSITAARAMTLAGVFSLVVILGVLSFLDEFQGEDRFLGLVLVGPYMVLASAAVLWLRYRPPSWVVKMDVDPGTMFVKYVMIMSAFATTPGLVGFVTFFLGQGIEFYLAGAAVSTMLLLLPARPTEELAGKLAESLGPGISGPALWDEVLRP